MVYLYSPMFLILLNFLYIHLIFSMTCRFLSQHRIKRTFLWFVALNRKRGRSASFRPVVRDQLISRLFVSEITLTVRATVVLFNLIFTDRLQLVKIFKNHQIHLVLLIFFISCFKLWLRWMI